MSVDSFTNNDLAAIERSTKEIGRYLFGHLNVKQPSVFDRRWWDDRIMAWAMEDESVKVQMFRFVDVLPMLARKSVEYVTAQAKAGITPFPHVADSLS